MSASSRIRRKFERAQRRAARAALPPEAPQGFRRVSMLEALLPPPPSPQAEVYIAPDGSGGAWREPDGTTRMVMFGGKFR